MPIPAWLTTTLFVVELIADYGVPAVKAVLDDCETSGEDITPEYVREKLRARFDKDPNKVFDIPDEDGGL